MDVHGPHRSWPGVDIVSELAAMNVEVDYDVMEIGPGTWAIHGRIAYDNEIIAATFPSERDAWLALSPLRPGATDAGGAPWSAPEPVG